MSIVLIGSTSGSITLQEPAVAGSTVLNLPATSGTVALTSQLPVASPAFRAYYDGTQNPSPNTWTKATLDTESFDTNNNFSTSTYRYTPTVAGYYQFNGNGNSTGSSPESYVAIRQNNSPILVSFYIASNINQLSLGPSGLFYMNGTTDYVELFIFSGAGSPAFSALVMSGYLARAV